LNLLFGLPLIWGVCLTACDVFAVLYLQNKGFRLIEALVITLISVIAVAFGIQVFLSKPDFGAMTLGLFPSSELLHNREMLYVAIGILGATVMPHNLYLHSSIAQTRHYELTPAGKREAIFFGTIDSTVALCFALLVNAAILVVAAATFYRTGHHDVAEIQDAYKLLSPLLGVGAASTLFAVALLASGQNSTLTGTLAGQIIMEGFLRWRLHPVLRRLVTRLVAIVPAVIVTAMMGESGTAQLLILSQVILSLMLSFAVVPLVMFTGDKLKMGQFANPVWMNVSAWVLAAVIALLNAILLWQTFVR
jgi:manganese transport protein